MYSFRNFIFGAVLLMGIQAYAPAAAAAECNLAGCTVTVSTDSGNSGKKCYGDDAMYCVKGAGFGVLYCNHGLVSATSNCPTGRDLFDYHIDGRKFCVDFNNNWCIPLEKRAQFEEFRRMRVTSDRDVPASQQLAEVFGSTGTLEATAHFGWVNGVNRSPVNTGRTTAAKAHLDICLGETDHDAIDSAASTDADRYSLCAGSTYGCGTPSKNDYCQANSSSACIDRCACAYPNNGVDTCNGI